MHKEVWPFSNESVYNIVIEMNITRGNNITVTDSISEHGGRDNASNIFQSSAR